MSRDTRIVIAILAAIVLVAFAAPLLAGATFVGRDHLTHSIPAKHFLVDALRDGRLPHWWPGVDLGVPFLANPNHSALYPPAWLMALLPMPWAVDLLLVLHVFFGGLGMAALAQRLGAQRSGMIVAATAFMLSGFTTSTIVHGGPALTLAWLPWIAWSADRVACARGLVAPALVLAAFVAGCLLAGDPSFAIGGALLALGLGLARAPRRVAVASAIVLANVVAVLLAAVMIVPALYLLPDSARSGGLAGDAAVAWSMHPLRLFELVWPNVLGDPNQTSEHLARAVADSSESLSLSPSWALSVYVSIPVLVLAAVGVMRAEKRTRLLAWVALVFVVLALGRYTPIYAAFRTVFVPEQIVRYPEKHIVGALVVASAFAGLGWQALVNGGLPRRVKVGGGTVLGALALLVGLGAVLLPGFVREHDVAHLAPALDVERGIAESHHQALVALAVTAAMSALVFLRRGRRWLAHVAVAVLVGHLASRSWALLPTFDREHLLRRPQILATARPGRIARPTEHRTRPADSLAAQARTLYEGAVPNAATRFGFSYLLGYDQGHSARFAKARTSFARPDDATSDRYGVELLIVEADESAGRPILGTDAPYGPYVLVANTGQRPRAFVTADDTLTPCAVTSPIPERVDLVCDVATDGLAVLLDGWAPGWSATVDGAPARIELADGLVRAVSVTAGRRTIAFRYATPGFGIGVAISTAAWILWLAGLLIARRASRRS